MRVSTLRSTQDAAAEEAERVEKEKILAKVRRDAEQLARRNWEATEDRVRKEAMEEGIRKAETDARRKAAIAEKRTVGEGAGDDPRQRAVGCGANGRRGAPPRPAADGRRGREEHAVDRVDAAPRGGERWARGVLRPPRARGLRGRREEPGRAHAAPRGGLWRACRLRGAARPRRRRH